MTKPTYKSAEAFQGLVNTLREAAEMYLDPDRSGGEIGVIESFRYLLHLTSAATDFYLEGDPERPEFVRMVSPTRKLGGDNPDATYHFARVRPDRSYRISGKRGRECYFSFSVHGRISEDRLGMTAEPLLADVNDRSLTIAPDGSYELILSPDERSGNWIPLAPNAASVIVRHYFEFEQTVTDDPDFRVDLRIEALAAPPVRPPANDADMARRIRDVTAFVRGGTIDLLDLSSLPVPFVSQVANELPQPSGFRASGNASWGAADVLYAMAPFRVEPEQALVMEGTLPPCAFANVVLWSRQMQTFEYRDRRVSLNRKQMVLERDGSYRIVIAHRDPGVPNWLDTENHTEGTIFWRFLLPEVEPAKSKCTLMPLSQVRK
ncbi:MAG: DUF1214 domain-containing protein [Deltaproteobacteria bacterium]|nr:DUF1214 domain-containing protein [Deltaproteobacteria bacterium]